MKKLVFSFALLLTGLVLGNQQQSTAQAVPPAEELDPLVGPGGPNKLYVERWGYVGCIYIRVNCLPTITIIPHP